LPEGINQKKTCGVTGSAKKKKMRNSPKGGIVRALPGGSAVAADQRKEAEKKKLSGKRGDAPESSLARAKEQKKGSRNGPQRKWGGEAVCCSILRFETVTGREKNIAGKINGKGGRTHGLQLDPKKKKNEPGLKKDWNKNGAVKQGKKKLGHLLANEPEKTNRTSKGDKGGTTSNPGKGRQDLTLYMRSTLSGLGVEGPQRGEDGPKKGLRLY